jgi:uncharacterized BrkB/YihY/UPF0761 family membrane protein
MKKTKEIFIYLICFLASLFSIILIFESLNEIDIEFQSKENIFKERLKLLSSLIFFSFGGISYYLLTKNHLNNAKKTIGGIIGSLAFILNGLVLFYYPETFSKGTSFTKKTIAIITIMFFGIGLIFGIYKLLIKKPRSN